MELKAATLRESLMIMQKVVPRKPAIASLTNVLFKDGKAIGTNLESMLILDVPHAEGECLLPQRKALDIFKHVPGNETVTILQEGKTVRLKWDGGSCELEVTDVNDFPSEANIEAESAGTISDGDSMAESLRNMLDYCATEAGRPLLTGVTVSFGEQMEVGASDGFRMAYQELPLVYPSPVRITIPAGSVDLFCSLWAKMPPPSEKGDTLVSTIMSKRPLGVSIGKEKISFHFNKLNIVSRFIQGEAANYAALLPQNTPIKVSVLASDMERCVKRVRGIAKDGAGAVRISWDNNKMTFGAKTNENSASAEMMVVSADNDAGAVCRTAVNGKYLLDYLSGKEGLVTIGITDDKGPILFHYGKTPAVVMMPMAVDW